MKYRKIIYTCLAAAVLATAVVAAHARGQNGSGANALAGSWKVRLTSADPSQPPFDELMTFCAGGGIVESNTFPFFLQGLTAGPGHGTWSYAGRQQFPFTFVKFLYAPAGGVVGTTGPAVGTLKVSGTITYSPADDTWSGPASVSFCDLQAENCFPLPTTEGRATRVVAGS